jgi:uncharacterized membrane protein
MERLDPQRLEHTHWTEALADSVASDVGVLSKKDPISLCRFRPVPRGLSGGVSLLGTAASFAATVFCAAIYLAFFRSLAGRVFWCCAAIWVASSTASWAICCRKSSAAPNAAA